MNLKDIHVFSMKWIEKYMSADSTERDMEEGFSEDCFALGFKMTPGMLLNNNMDKNGKYLWIY